MLSKNYIEPKNQSELEKKLGLVKGDSVSARTLDDKGIEKLGLDNFQVKYPLLFPANKKMHGFDGMFLGADNEIKFFESKSGKSSIASLLSSAKTTIKKHSEYSRTSEVETVADKFLTAKLSGKLTFPIVTAGVVQNITMSQGEIDKLLKRTDDVLNFLSNEEDILKNPVPYLEGEMIMWVWSTSKVKHMYKSLPYYDWGLVKYGK